MNRILKLIITVVLLLNINWALKLHAQERITFGSVQEDIAHSLKIYNGKYYIVGTTRKDAKSALDYYVVQLRSNGSVEKEYTFGYPKHDVANQVVVDENGLFVLGAVYDGGYPNVDMHLVKLANNGEKEWEKYYGTQYQDMGFNIIRTRDGGFAMIGFSNTQEDGGDMYCVKTDDAGEVKWEKLFGPPRVDYGFCLVENDNEEILFGGTENGFFNPTQTEFQTHDADIFIVKTDKNGNKLWSKTYGGDKHDWCKDIIAAPDGGYFVSGSTQSFGAGSFDIFLMKIDENGNELWMKTFGGSAFDYGEKLQMGADGTIFIAGTSASYSLNHKPDHFIIKTDIEGNEIWAETFGTDQSEYTTGLVATPDSGVVFTGWYNAGEIGKADLVFYKLSKEGKTQIISNITPFDSVSSVVVYPNPAKQHFTVEVISPSNNKLDFILFNALGQRVLKKKIDANTKNDIRNRYKSGMYIYRIENEGVVLRSGKLMIQF